MPRTAREKSDSGCYHIVMRGINRQVLFKDDQDYRQFLIILRRCKENLGLEVLGWCLMNNHVHLLLKEGSENISDTMKRIGVSYARYHHAKYDCIGPLFQDRFYSEAVEDDTYLLTVIRYIHQNPVKAKLVHLPSDWKWSSCPGYYGKKVTPSNLLDPVLIFNIMHAGDQEKAQKMFKAFNEASNEDRCLDYTEKRFYTDEEIRKMIYKLFPEIGQQEFKSLPKNMQKKIIKQVISIDGVTQSRTANIIGVSQGYISKMGK